MYYFYIAFKIGAFEIDPRKQALLEARMVPIQSDSRLFVAPQSHSQQTDSNLSASSFQSTNSDDTDVVNILDFTLFIAFIEKP